ncbi:DedA family protein [Desulfobulbus rhabdoformis]|uniref:YqaA family protein n=1 Tax=Desulfobulbus rhabdoformis TaxID=34032 RepID=UPI001966460E|nr:DedA family protein [Desulfobulbus rhabdoformis]
MDPLPYAHLLPYGTLFTSALVAATIFPMQSEAVLVGLLVSDGYSPLALLLIASCGNILGSVINWWLGRSIDRFRHCRWFPADEKQLLRAENWYHRYGRWSLLLSWAPIIGDPLTVVAGVLGEPLPGFLVLVGVAKFGRYLVLVSVTLGWMG